MVFQKRTPNYNVSLMGNKVFEIRRSLLRRSYWETITSCMRRSTVRQVRYQAQQDAGLHARTHTHTPTHTHTRFLHLSSTRVFPSTRHQVTSAEVPKQLATCTQFYPNLSQTPGELLMLHTVKYAQHKSPVPSIFLSVITRSSRNRRPCV